MSGTTGGRHMWRSGEAYERYMGRWSRRVAIEFLRWLGRSGGRWVDVGCGSGALSAAVLAVGSPEHLVGMDSSVEFVRYAHGQGGRSAGLGAGNSAGRGEGPGGLPARFVVADARRLPLRAGVADTCAAGLVLNFVPGPAAAVAEMRRVTRVGGTVAAYVWDYAEGMQPLRCFWDAARDRDPDAGELDEGACFPLCRPGPLAALFGGAGLIEVETAALTVPTRFGSFADYWTPFLGGKGPAPTYVMSLDAAQRDALRDMLAARLATGADGGIELKARAWAVRGTVSADAPTWA